MSEKAFALHSHLQAKHASIINSRYFESAKVVFDHRKTIEKDVLGKYLLSGRLSIQAEDDASLGYFRV